MHYASKCGRISGVPPNVSGRPWATKEAFWGSAHDSSNQPHTLKFKPSLLQESPFGSALSQREEFLQPQSAPSLTHQSVFHLQIPADARSVPKDSWQQKHQGELGDVLSGPL